MEMVDKICRRCQMAFKAGVKSQIFCGSLKSKTGCSYQASLERSRAWIKLHPEKHSEYSRTKMAKIYTNGGERLERLLERGRKSYHKHKKLKKVIHKQSLQS